MSSHRNSPSLLSEIVYGEAVGAADARPHRREGQTRRLATGEDGMLSLATAIAVLMFIVLIGLLGNLGRTVTHKIEVQNAADATAYSSALWMARGMNAITATNHLLGELTAFVVLDDAIGGPELGQGPQGPTPEMEIYNGLIVGLLGTGLVAILPPDVKFCSLVANTVTEDRAGYTAGAMLYDSRMTLKWVVAFSFGAKIVGNGLIVTYVGAPLGVALHAGATVALGKALVEWRVLNFIETVAALPFLRHFKTEVEGRLIPWIQDYADEVARDGPTSNLGGAVRLAVRHLGERNDVEAAINPSPSRLRLPILREERPAATGGATGLPDVSNWDNWPPEFTTLINLQNRGLDLSRRLLRLLSGVTGRVTRLVNEWAPGLSELIQYVTALDEQLGQLDRETSFQFGFMQNPSREALEKMPADWQHERTSQWTRATYPHVDKLRAPIMNGLNNPVTGVPLSRGPTWYLQWTDRYTLARSFDFQTRDQGRSMYVLQDMKPDRKGREPWASDSDRAEELFTVVGFARRRVRTVMSPSAFGDPGSDVVIAYAQAIVYNANPQDPRPARSGVQPNVGWDTLNWQPPVGAHEYGNFTRPRGSSWPWDVFRGGAKDAPRVQLNWQAKLVPVTPSRLARSRSDLPVAFRSAVEQALQRTGAAERSRHLNTH